MERRREGWGETEERVVGELGTANGGRMRRRETNREEGRLIKRAGGE